MSNSTPISQNLNHASARFGLTSEELQKFCDDLNRTPSLEEIAACGALWSEHCSYKSSKSYLKNLHTQEPWVLQGPGENAGVVAINKEYAIAFKMESHNHPSFIEPYQGAATGVGGILRDVFCMGAYPIAALNCLRFGEGTWNAHLLRDTVRGVANYGNAFGVPNVTGDISFHYNYSKNILVNAFCAGLVHKEKIFKGIVSDQKHKNHVSTSSTIVPQIHEELSENLNSVLFPENENVLIYFGSATGRDGVHGATMSSAEFSSLDPSLKPTVQVGDPFAGKVLFDATLSLIEKNLVVGLQDLGAAGITSSSVEMAARSGYGVALNLNHVPQRMSDMQAWEILLSESQERMLCAVTPKNINAVCLELEHHKISYAIIGKINRTGLFTCLFDNKIVTATPISVLVDKAPRYQHTSLNRDEYLKQHKIINNKSQEELNLNNENKPSLTLKASNPEAHQDIQNNLSLELLVEKYPQLIANLFAHPSFSDRSAVFHNYCSTVQGNTVAGCGALQSAAAGVVRLPHYAQEKDSHGVPSATGIAVAGGCEERWVELDPLHGTALSVIKIARKIVASGAVPLAMTDCLNLGNPKSATVIRQLSDIIDGINLVATEFRIPVVSGNVSLNNQTDGNAIPPTPMVGVLGRVDNINSVPLNFLTQHYFTKTQSESVSLYHIMPKNGFESSSYRASQTAWLLGDENADCPKVEISIEKELWRIILTSIAQNELFLCNPIGHGGLLGTLIATSLKSMCDLELSKFLWKMPAEKLFAEGNMGFLISFKNKNAEKQFLQRQYPNFSVQKVAELKPENCSIAMPVFDFQKVYQNYCLTLKQFFNTLSCADKEPYLCAESLVSQT
jgi:phosphoribosylformylglycinamidine synthase